MRFYFPDSQDQISPTYDFVHEEYLPTRVRQRDDVYAHEVLTPRPYDGLLVSKAIVDGSIDSSGKYTSSAKQRLYRLGIREFYRLPEGVVTLGDCGAFNYKDEDSPPYSTQEVMSFYEDCGFDAGVSVDHVILGFDNGMADSEIPQRWTYRQKVTLELAREFLEQVSTRDSRLEPLGAAQGWSALSYAQSVLELHEMGYKRIAMGGMVPLSTNDIISTLEAVADLKLPDLRLHLLGITRLDAATSFQDLGVESFDSTSPFRQAFMDDRMNYHSPEGFFVAVRIPQVEGNASLKRAILSGRIDQRDASRLEAACLAGIRGFDRGTVSLESVLDALAEYEELLKPRRTYIEDYRKTLGARPWKSCPCAICQTHGVEVIVFRGTERNKRRGFHNLWVFRNKQLGSVNEGEMKRGKR